MKNYQSQLLINTLEGEKILEKIYFTELGFVMAKIYDPKSKTWQNKQIGNLDSLLSNIDVQIKETITLKPSTLKKLEK